MQAVILTVLFAAIYILVRKVLAVWPKIEGIIDKAGETTGTVSDTAHTVSSTTSYLAGNVVAPLIKLMAFIAGSRKALVVLFTGPQVPESREGGG